jgi:hypothetical protein
VLIGTDSPSLSLERCHSLITEELLTDQYRLIEYVAQLSMFCSGCRDSFHAIDARAALPFLERYIEIFQCSCANI